jgi:outer membrane immunogenic protein
VTPGTTTTGATSSKANVNGFIGGVQAGYNWQVQRSWLLGFEADFQGSAERGSITECSLAGCVAGSAVGTANYKLRWFGTARGRVGYLPTEWLVLYATGGLAYGRFDADYASGINLAGFPFLAGSTSTTRLGWTVGAGAEGAIDRNWSWKAEYLYMDLGGFDANLGSATASVTGPAIPVADARFLIQQTIASTTAARVSTRFSDHIFRFGINYRFTDGPVVARY